VKRLFKRSKKSKKSAPAVRPQQRITARKRGQPYVPRSSIVAAPPVHGMPLQPVGRNERLWQKRLAAFSSTTPMPMGMIKSRWHIAEQPLFLQAEPENLENIQARMQRRRRPLGAGAPVHQQQQQQHLTQQRGQQQLQHPIVQGQQPGMVAAQEPLPLSHQQRPILSQQSTLPGTKGAVGDTDANQKHLVHTG
jgi:hypothetical protein